MYPVRYVRFVLGALVAMLLLAACGTSSAPTAVPAGSSPAATTAKPPEATAVPAVKKGGTLRFAISADITNSSLILTKPAQWVYQTMFNSLTNYDVDTLEVRPDLAESWSVSSDGKLWTFNLRKDVKWHDGQPLTAADVKFTFDTVINPKINAGFHRGNFANVDSVTIEGDYVVKLNMKAPEGDMPALLGDYLHIFPKHLLENADMNQPADFLDHPVGSGPFKFSEHVRNDRYVVVANEQYFKGRPALDSIIFKVLPDANTQVAQFKSGDLDFSDILAAAQLQALANEPKVRIFNAPTPDYWHIFINNKSPLLEDKRVRQALNYGLDRSLILKQVMGGLGTLASGPIAPDLTKWRNTSLQPYPYDVAKAKALLSDAGWTDSDGDGILDKVIAGQKTPFKVTIIVIPAQAAWEDIALIAQQQWKLLGMDVTLDKQDTNTGFGKVQAGNYTLYVGSRGPIPSPVDLKRYFACGAGGNWFRSCNPEADNQVNIALNATDAAARKAAADKAQQLLYEDSPTLFLFYVVDSEVISKRVTKIANADLRRILATIEKVEVTP
jgi:peptide/nickel transport system substrate-binding protein